MELTLGLASVLGAILLGAISPGPSFVLVARTSMAGSRTNGLFTAIGMGIGAMVFSVVVLLGLQVVLSSVPLPYLLLKLVGGLYLVYIAANIWRGAKEPILIHNVKDKKCSAVNRSLFLGGFSQLSNPKTAVVYGGIFAALLPHDLPTHVAAALPILVFLVEAGWYSFVAIALSAESSQAAYLRSKNHIDRVAGGIMGIIGLKLIAAARPAP